MYSIMCTNTISETPPVAVKLWEALVNGDDRQLSSYLNLLVSYRNSRHPSFIEDGRHDVSTTSNVPFREPSTIEEYRGPHDNAVELEVERLRRQEKALTDEISELNQLITIAKKMAKSDAEKCQKKANELKKKTEQNIKGAKEARQQKASFKEKSKSVELMALDMADRIDFSKKITETFLKVRDGAVCEDQDFCREFGGKCHSTKH